MPLLPANRVRRVFVILVLSSLLAGSACAGPYDEAVTHARKIIEAYVAKTRVPSLQIAVAVDREIVWSQAFGRADVARDRPATTGSVYRIASVSKLLTGTLLAKLADQGVLDLDRPIEEYVPDLPKTWRGITARMLVHHTSGIPHYASREDALDTTYYPTPRAAIARFRDRPLANAPGRGEKYSSYAYTVLALAIENAAGRPFLDIMREEILDPLGMTHTTTDLQSSPPPERTAFYELDADGSLRKAPYVDLSGRWAASGYLSTAEDLVRFGSAHTRSGVLPDHVVALVAQRDTLPDGSLTKEGFGWGPRSDWDGKRMLWGDGSTPGCRCGLLVYPEDGLVIAILTNARGLALERGEFQTLARLFFAARAGNGPRPEPDWANGRWVGKVEVGDATIGVDIDLSGPGGSVEFERWRSFEIADEFRVGDRLWVVPLDRKGFFPLTLARDGDAIEATAPRAGWSFRLIRPSER